MAAAAVGDSSPRMSDLEAAGAGTGVPSFGAVDGTDTATWLKRHRAGTCMGGIDAGEGSWGVVWPLRVLLGLARETSQRVASNT